MQTPPPSGKTQADLLDIVHNESVRMETYKRFSECFRQPDQSLEISLNRLSTLLKLRGEGTRSIDGMIRVTQNPDALHSALVDFSRLFVGPYTMKAPPYGSIYLESDRTIMGDSTMDAVRHYEEAGLTMNDRFCDVPDHIRAELEFMYFLIFRSIKAINENRPDEALDFFNRQAVFLQHHIGAWFSKFADRIESQAKTAFYRFLSGACSTFIAKEVAASEKGLL